MTAIGQYLADKLKPATGYKLPVAGAAYLGQQCLFPAKGHWSAFRNGLQSPPQVSGGIAVQNKPQDHDLNFAQVCLRIAEIILVWHLQR